jgi:hypothetical protein
MSLLVRRCLNRTHLVEQLVESWQYDHNEAMRARDLEELATECLDLAKLGRRAWKCLRAQMFDKNVSSAKVFAAEDMLKPATQRIRDVFKVVGKLIASAERAGYQIEGSAEFAQASKDLELLRQEIEQQFPDPDPQMMADSKAAFLRGEYQTAEELLHELQGGSAAAHK